MDDDDLYGGTEEAEETPAIKAENEVDMDGDEEEEEEESDDVRIPVAYVCIENSIDHIK